MTVQGFKHIMEHAILRHAPRLEEVAVPIDARFFDDLDQALHLAGQADGLDQAALSDISQALRQVKAEWFRLETKPTAPERASAVI